MITSLSATSRYEHALDEKRRDKTMFHSGRPDEVRIFGALVTKHWRHLATQHRFAGWRRPTCFKKFAIVCNMSLEIVPFLRQQAYGESYVTFRPGIQGPAG